MLYGTGGTTNRVTSKSENIYVFALLFLELCLKGYMKSMKGLISKASNYLFIICFKFTSYTPKLPEAST
jgi:hypothetical protein